jgi:hypothetical protein
MIEDPEHLKGVCFLSCRKWGGHEGFRPHQRVALALGLSTHWGVGLPGFKFYLPHLV